MLIVSCNRTDLNGDQASLYTAATQNEQEAAVKNAWAVYKSGQIETAGNAFAAILNSADEDFIRNKSVETGLRLGYGFSLLASHRLDEAIYQFEFESDKLIESALGAASAYFLKREYASAINCFTSYDKLYYQSSPYRSIFPICNDINVESHKIIFLSYYYSKNFEQHFNIMSQQYKFICEKTAEIGINSDVCEIFNKSIDGR